MKNLNGLNPKSYLLILIINFSILFSFGSNLCYYQDNTIDYPEIVESFKKLNNSDIEENLIEQLRIIGFEINKLANSMKYKDTEIKTRALNTFTSLVDEFISNEKDMTTIEQYYLILYNISEKYDKGNDLTNQLEELEELIK